MEVENHNIGKIRRKNGLMASGQKRGAKIRNEREKKQKKRWEVKKGPGN